MNIGAVDFRLGHQGAHLSEIMLQFCVSRRGSEEKISFAERILGSCLLELCCDLLNIVKIAFADDFSCD